GARYRLGDRLTVKVARVDLETSKIDFTLVTGAGKTSNQNLGDNTGQVKSGNKPLSINKDKASADFKMMSTRALEKAKKDRSGAKKASKIPTKAGAKPSSKPSSKPASKSRNTKNKGKR
ncbi:MAG: ribonuclease R, partial [Methylotenera sp.]